MYTSFLLFLVIPWIIGYFIFLRNNKLFLIIFPLVSMIAFTVDEIGTFLDFWEVKPFLFRDKSFSTLPFNLGFYPVLTSLMMLLIHNKKFKPGGLILLFTILTTFLEWLYLSIGNMNYSNGWNIFWTFFSYLIPYTFVYYYYHILKKFNVFNDKVNRINIDNI